MLALDATSGKQIWKTYTIPEEPQQTSAQQPRRQLFGPSGAGVWGAPALDAARNRVYVATGDAYSQPAAPSTDAIMALAMDTGKIVWVRQTLAGMPGTPRASGRTRRASRTVRPRRDPTTTSALPPRSSRPAGAVS